MSVLYECKFGWILSHETFIKNTYKNVQTQNEGKNYQFKKLLFNIKCPYLRYNQNNENNKLLQGVPNLQRKRKKNNNSKFEELIAEVENIEKNFKLFSDEINYRTIFKNNKPPKEIIKDNKRAQNEADKCYNEIDKIVFTNSLGSNGDNAILQTVNDAQFLFPKLCRFFCKNITEMEQVLLDETFDVILLDPPWWNKYIRRKNARSNQGYQMMYNVNLSVIPMKKILSPNGLVVIWCTNSPQHLKDLREEICPKWGIKLIAKWYWLKVTTEGVPICSFSDPPGKQPFEQIIFGVHEKNNCSIEIPDGKIVISIPSALNSHKPPLNDLLTLFTTKEATLRCLEIFARYLLPGWTSWGLEVLKLQHEFLYERTGDEESRETDE